MRWFFVVAVSLGLCSFVLACSEDPSSSPADAGTVDAETAETEDAAPVDAGKTMSEDASTDAKEAGGGLKPTKKTALAAAIGGVSRTLERAQFGVTTEGASETLHVEAHQGGIATCPESETPERTMIVSGVPKGAPGDAFGKKDGVTVSFVDFVGDQITANNPTTKASAATVTFVAFDDDVSVELEVTATFPEGTAKGRIYATYCAAMSE